MEIVIWGILVALIICGVIISFQIHKLKKEEKDAKKLMEPSKNAKWIFQMIEKGYIACQVGENHAEKFDALATLENYKSPVMLANIKMIQNLNVQARRLEEIYGTNDD